MSETPFRYVVTVHLGYQCDMYTVNAEHEGAAIGKVAKLPRYKTRRTIIRAYPFTTGVSPRLACYIITE
jgi:hypothetical protein